MKRHLVDKVERMITDTGLVIIKKKLVLLTPIQVRTIWQPCVSQPFFPEMLSFSIASPSLIFIINGEDAIAILNDLVGYHNPDKAKWWTIRHRYGTDKMRNVIHSSDNEADFWREFCVLN